MMSRPQMAAFLREFIKDPLTSQLRLDLAKGDDALSGIALLVSNASGATKAVFVSALGNVFQFVEDDLENGVADPDMIKRSLLLAEVGLFYAGSGESEKVFQVLLRLLKNKNDKIVEAAARVLSYISSVAATLALQKLYDDRADNATIAAYLIIAKTRFDPLTALEISFSQLKASALDEVIEFRLAIRDALKEMLATNGPMVRFNLRTFSKEWPEHFVKFIIDVLSTSPLNALPVARKVVEDIKNRNREDGNIASGVAHRVMQKGILSCMDGYSMSAVEYGEYRSYRAPWMDCLADEASRLLNLQFPDFGPCKPQFLRWPPERDWTEVVQRVKIAREGQRISQTTDICFEMVYLDDSRSDTFGVVQIAQLTSFTVMCNDKNPALSGVIKKYSNSSLPPVQDFLEDITKVEGAWRVFAITNNAATHQLLEMSDELLPRDRLDQFGRLRDVAKKLETPLDGYAVCDNIAAEVIERQTQRDFSIVKARLAYSSPVPVGLVYDSSELQWPLILENALFRSLASTDENVKKSWLKHVQDLATIDAIFRQDLYKKLHGQMERFRSVPFDGD